MSLDVSANYSSILPRCVLDDVPSPAWRASKSIVAALSKRKSGNLSAVIARFLCLVFRWTPEKKMGVDDDDEKILVTCVVVVSFSFEKRGR